MIGLPRKPAMIYGSVCSGIEAASVAWHPLGWRAAFFSETEPFPRAVLAERWPGVPIHGDFTTIDEGDYEPIELLVGGTPCQDFSVAGLAGERGNLSIEFVRLAGLLRPRWVVWENVPGVLSIDEGRAFGAFLGGLGQCGYGFAYRVLDAQHFGVPQRRRRVFVVGYLGDWRPAAAVLFEPESLRRDPSPRREAGERVARPIAGCAEGGSGYRNDADTADNLIAFGGNNTAGPLDVATACNAHGGPHGRLDFESETFITRAYPDPVYALRPGKQDEGGVFGSGRDGQDTFVTGHFEQNSLGQLAGMSVRRLTPKEAERLQGFPDDYTNIPAYNRRYTGPFGGNRGVSDGPRYRALGNSMAVPCMRWLGERISLVSEDGQPVCGRAGLPRSRP